MQTTTPKKILTFPIRLALIIILYALLFINMGWPYGHNLIFVGGLILTVLYVIRFSFKKTKVRVDYVKLSIVLIWFLGLFGVIFNLFHINKIIDVILIVLIVWWLIEDGFSSIINRRLVNKTLIKVSYYFLLILSIGLLCVGYLFRIQHWPYGNIMFTLGVLLFSLLIIVDHFAIERR